MTNKRLLLRIIVPAFPSFNIYTRIARKTTAYGPVCVATNANKLENWDVEVIDENNTGNRLCPKNKQGLVDHHKLQETRKADVVGFYGSLTSTVLRIFKLAEFYKQGGAVTIAGGKHVENLPEEALENNIDYVFFGEAEESIKEFLKAIECNFSMEKVAGIAFIKDGVVFKTPDKPLIEDFDNLPYPDFSLVKYAKIKVYPISRVRGCNMHCEFCAVKDRARYATPKKMMAQIAHSVETYGAKNFFESSDHFAPNKEEAIEFCELLAGYQKEKGIRIKMTVQIRLNDARHEDLLAAMKKAGIHNVCIGYESPIDEELLAMRKGYLSKDMREWTKIFHKYGFFIHGMFIFGYPYKKDMTDNLTLDDKIKRFKKFIYSSKIDTVQLLLTVPLLGTDLRQRLEDESRLYDIDWQYYDGQFPLFVPDDGVEPEELQKAVNKIMRRFYGAHNLGYIVFNILFNFPLWVFPAVFTLFSFRVRYLVNSFRGWQRIFFRNQVIRFGGHFIVKEWLKKFKKGSFLAKLKRAKQKVALGYQQRKAQFKKQSMGKV